MQADTERRKDGRQPMLTYFQLSQGHRVQAMARTIDLSCTGFAGTSDVMLHVYQEIGVGINGLGTVYGTVVWKVGSKFAVQFKTPIDIEMFDVSSIVQPDIALPDWFSEHSESHGNFAESDIKEPNNWEPVRMATESVHEEEPCGTWDKSEVEQYTPPEPVRIATESVHEEEPCGTWGKSELEQYTPLDPLRVATESFYEEKPRDPRNKTSARIEIRKSGLKKCKADILNISQAGFQLDCPLHLNEGERLLVDLPGLRALSAITIWHNDLRTGFKFETPISEYVYNDLIRRLSN